MKKRIPLYFINPKDGTEMALIPGGWFRMGSGDDDPDAYDSEMPAHLHFVDPFYISIACITVEQFRRFVEETGYSGGDYSGSGDSWNERWGYWKKDPPEHPARHLNWHDCSVYCKWAGLRLSSEAEWEFAARGYEALKYPWGKEWEAGRRVCCDKQRGPTGETAPVFDHPEGTGRFGAFQQSGNVWEWCQDKYRALSEKTYLRVRHSI